MKNTEKIECPYCVSFVTPSYVSKEGETFCSNCGVSLKYIFPFSQPRHQPQVNSAHIHSEIRVAAVQLDIEFGYHILQSRPAPSLYDKWPVGRANKRKKTLISIVKYLCQKEKPHVICFPELSVPPDSLNNLLKLAKEYNVIIVAGSHYTEDRVNTCPVIFPNGTTCFSDKFFPSVWECAPNQFSRMERGKNLFYLTTQSGKKIFFMICMDFLHLDELIKFDKQGIVVVFCLMCSPKLESFYETARILMKRGIYTILCNAIGGIKDTNITFPGETSFFGSINKHYMNLEQQDDKEQRLSYLKNETGVIVASFSLDQPFASTIPTDLTRTNYCNYTDPKIIPIIRVPIYPLVIGKKTIHDLLELETMLQNREIEWDNTVRNKLTKWAEKKLHSSSLAKKIMKCNTENDFTAVIKEIIQIKNE